jgi:hypothetical protein
MATKPTFARCDSDKPQVEVSMRTITIAGFAAATLLVGSALTPAEAMPIQPAGVNQAGAAADNYVEVQYRRRYVRPYRYARPRYYYGGGYPYGGYGYGYGGYPYGGYYGGGPSVQVGPFGFGFRRW